jgi:quercetin dioxygenase-like cupin family protein
MTDYSFPNLQTEKGKPEKFTGAVQLGEVVRSNDGRNVRVQKVEFSPKARTHWHMHSAEQVLVVLAPYTAPDENFVRVFHVMQQS